MFFAAAETVSAAGYGSVSLLLSRLGALQSLTHTTGTQLGTQHPDLPERP